MTYFDQEHLAKHDADKGMVSAPILRFVLLECSLLGTSHHVARKSNYPTGERDQGREALADITPPGNPVRKTCLAETVRHTS